MMNGLERLRHRFAAANFLLLTVFANPAAAQMRTVDERKEEKKGSESFLDFGQRIKRTLTPFLP